jgi:hypothetical protein
MVRSARRSKPGLADNFILYFMGKQLKHAYYIAYNYKVMIIKENIQFKNL